MNAFRYAFINAKMHGLMAKAFLDKRLEFLVKIANLIELSRTLFPESSPVSFETETVSSVQRRFETSVIAALQRLLRSFVNPPPLLVHVLREYDYRNFFTLLRERLSGLTNIHLWDIGEHSLLRLSPHELQNGVKDLSGRFRGTPFEKYIPLLESLPLCDLEFEAGKEYYRDLVACVHHLPSAEKRLVLPLLKTEVLLENLVWALRLRLYFRMDFEEAKKKLFLLDFFKAEDRVRIVFDLNPESPQDWKRLGFGGIFCTARDGAIDPPAIEKQAHGYLYKKFRRVFYSCPFTVASVYAFFRIKKHEARLVTSVSEGIYMGLSFTETGEAVGIP